MEIVRPIVQECFIPAQYTSSPEIIKNCLQEVFTEEEEKKLKELTAAEFAEHPNRTANSIDIHYERYCKQIGIAKKGNHKARKNDSYKGCGQS